MHGVVRSRSLAHSRDLSAGVYICKRSPGKRSSRVAAMNPSIPLHSSGDAAAANKNCLAEPGHWYLYRAFVRAHGCSASPTLVYVYAERDAVRERRGSGGSISELHRI